MKEIYDWVPWFRELAKKIEEGGEAYLIEKARMVKWGEENPYLLRYDDRGIDPFSFFYFLASKATTRNKRNQRVYSSVHEVFEIESPLPDTGEEDYYIFPTPQPNAALFHDGNTFNPDLLWRLFRQVVVDVPIIAPDDFKKVFEIRGVRVTKLTQALFLINPQYFLPIDNSTSCLSEALDFPDLSIIKTEIEKDGGYGEYLSILEKLKEIFPGCQPYEIDRFLYETNSRSLLPKAGSHFFQITTKVHDDETDYWDDFKENNWVYTGGPGSGKSWGEEGEYPLSEPRRGDIILVRTGRKRGRAIGIVQKNDYAELDGLDKNSKIHVLWINKSERELSQETDQQGFNKVGSETHLVFDLIKRLIGNSSKNKSNLDDQHSGADTMKHPLNQILYGPPGTGKTWNTANYAVAIIEGKSVNELEEEDRKEVKQRLDKLKEEGQIEMVTFHQNFIYEDFIEGIRPILKKNESRDTQDIQYELSKGVFRKITDRADKNRMQSEQADNKSWNMGELLRAFAKSIEEKLKLKKEINLSTPEGRSGATIIAVNKSEDGNFESVLLGGSVTSRHTLNIDKIKEEYDDFYKGETTSPEDIKGLTGNRQGLATYYFPLLQTIKQFHDEKWQPEEPVTVEKQNYVLIIDEINRGNIAKIFGELITLIEPSKRIGSKKDETTVTLPYSKEKFGVPNNLYIIGTMNTADRSIALLDTALRRRFDFIEMMPDSKHVSDNIDGVDCQKLLDAMNKRIRFLLDREHQIGHTYFMGVKRVKGKDSLEATFKNGIIPLLQEYFYDNWEKIDLVLNCNGFVHEIPFESDLFKNSDLIDKERKIYELSDDDGKWEDSESYQAIYAQGQSETDEAG